jgi:hypothetical protein
LVRFITLPPPAQKLIAGITLTWTLAWRTNGQPIENLGVDAATEIVDRADAGQLTADDTPELVAYSRFVLSEVKEGRGLGTKNTVPGFLGGIAEITPAPNHYTKKVVVVVNALSFSAAEFLAAILQDNQSSC